MYSLANMLAFCILQKFTLENIEYFINLSRYDQAVGVFTLTLPVSRTRQKKHPVLYIQFGKSGKFL